MDNGECGRCSCGAASSFRAPQFPTQWLCFVRRYEGVVAAISTAGNFIVHFEGYGTQEEVDKSNVRQAPSNADAGGSGYTGPPTLPLWHVYHSCDFVLPKSTQAADCGAEFAAAGVAAPKRREVFEEDATDEMPAWLEIKPTGQLCLHRCAQTQHAVRRALHVTTLAACLPACLRR